MPAFEEEVIDALEEGVEFRFLVNPTRIWDEKGTKRLECLRMKLAEKDETGRRRAVPVPDSQFILEADHVIIAAGEEIVTTGMDAISDGAQVRAVRGVDPFTGKGLGKK